MINIHEFAARLEAAGHTVEWGFDGPVIPNAPGDPGWWFKIDGEVVATGGSIGLLEAEVAAWVEESGAMYERA